MTIAEALREADTAKPNRFERAKKVAWLAQLEGQIYREIVRTHADPIGIRPPKFDNNTDPDTPLIAPFPYDEVYPLWLQCRIDLGNMEIGKYNNDRTLFNNALMTLRDYWNRTFMPCERVRCFDFDKRRDPVPCDGESVPCAESPLDTQGAEHEKIRGIQHEHYPNMGGSPPRDPVMDQIMDIRRVDREQGHAIDELEKNAVMGDDAITSAEIEVIVNG